MRIALLTVGSRGDVQPMVVLASALIAQGHEVRLGVPSNLVVFAERAGLDVVSLGPNSQEILESPEGRAWLASGQVHKFMGSLRRLVQDNAAAICANARQVSTGADVVVGDILTEDIAACIGEADRIPAVALHSAPVRANRTYPSPVIATRPLPGPLAQVTGAVFEQFWWLVYRAGVNAFRESLGLRSTWRAVPSRLAAAGARELQIYSRLVVPGLDGWARRPLVGYLTMDAALRRRIGESGLAPDLQAWLGAGDPPVYFGFGSTPVLDPPAMLHMLQRVAGRLGVRALVSSGWSGIDNEAEVDPDCVRVIGAVDHDVLLPRCAAAVHHGGAGTTAASLRAGVPTVVCSFFGDMPFWGARVEQLGVGSHLRLPEMTEASLEAALRRAIDSEVVIAAHELGVNLQAEGSGASRAADLILAEAAATAPSL